MNDFSSPNPSSPIHPAKISRHQSGPCRPKLFPSRAYSTLIPPPPSSLVRLHYAVPLLESQPAALGCETLMDRNGLVELELFRSPRQRRLMPAPSWEIWHAISAGAMCRGAPIVGPGSPARFNKTHDPHLGVLTCAVAAGSFSF